MGNESLYKMTKMAAMAINSKNLQNPSSLEPESPIILKLGMKHQAMELYKVYINHDPWMTLTYFMTRSTEVAHAFEWVKLLKCHLMGLTCSKLANGLNFYDLKKKLTPGVVLTLPCGYIHV